MGNVLITCRSIGLRVAEQALATIRSRLEADGRCAVIAVADRNGELLALVRLDGAPAASVRVAADKAWTAARHGTTTAALAERSRKGQWDFAFFGDDRSIGWGGGVPVRFDDELIGAVGVSGLSQKEDEAYATLGAGAIVEAIRQAAS